MSFYNIVFEYNHYCILVLPMLGRKPEEYPRFRDCFVTEEGNIAVYTRVGGGNRNCGYEEEVLYDDPDFIRTYDDAFDSTYGTYEFRVPEKWKEDFDKIMSGDAKSVSDEYVDTVRKMYPKLAEEGVLDKVFKRTLE